MYERFAAVLPSGEGGELFGDIADEKAVAVKNIVSDTDAAQFFYSLKDGETICFSVIVSGVLPDLYFSRVEFFAANEVYVMEENSNGWEYFYNWLTDTSKPKATCDSKEIYKVCLCRNIKPGGLRDDIVLAAYLDDPGYSSYALKDVTARYLDRPKMNSSENISALLVLLKEKLAERGLNKLYSELEMPLAPVLAQMEYTGIKADMELLDQLAEDMVSRIDKLEKTAQEQAGEDFNLKSPKQLGTILFEKLKLPVIKKVKTGYSTDVKVLEQLRGRHPLVSTILEHRRLAKLYSTYLDGLKPLVNPKTKRIHTHFQQAVTVTGRLSSTDPNLQNIPTRTEEGRQIRRIFVPGDGYDYLMSCDYSQVELRILACIAQDEVLLESFRNKEDVHARTAAEVFGISLDQVTAQMRNKAKAVNFGIVYGISDFGLAQQLNVARNEAAGYIASYFSRYNGVRKYMDDMIELARSQGYVTTLMGRRRYLPDINSSNFNLRSFAERTAINTPIQGTAADIMKFAMIKVSEDLAAVKLKTRILLQVHDELVLEVPEEEKEEAAELVRNAMEGAAALDIPLLTDVKFGKNWALAK